MKLALKKGSRRLREFRLSYPFVFYLVSTAKAEGAARLNTRASFEVIVSEISRLEREGVWEVLSLVLMPTPLHMIVRLGRGQDLSRAMKLFKGRTARLLNEQNKRSGRIWYKGFHDRLVRDSEKLSGYYNYLLKNPVKAGLCSCPAGYPYFLIKPEICELL